MKIFWSELIREFLFTSHNVHHEGHRIFSIFLPVELSSKEPYDESLVLIHLR